ncbi:MAG: TonB-dependent receptor [Burkholderiaceae bacterium]
MSPSFVGRPCAAWCVALAGIGSLHAEDSPRPALAPVEVTASSERVPDVEIPPDNSNTVLNRNEMERRQADNIFELVRDAPGVMVEGGPRASGMRFNIRGFSDNEDVVFKIDGAAKGFEKYRFGSGVFIEPELLKALEIQRGPSLTSGSGALGGAISATTRSAADFLRPGQRVGAMAKFGFNFNNRERLRMLTTYARPTGYVDLLASFAYRDSTDVKLSDGTRLDVSATHSESSLLKASFFPTDHLSVELSRIAYESGPDRAPYDATRQNPDAWGIVRRSIDDETINLRIRYAPPDSWINLRGTLAHEKTYLHDQHLFGESGICASSAALSPCNDYWRYDIWTAELFNDTVYRWGAVAGTLTLGAQAIRNRRDIVRITASEQMNQRIYPGGFNEAQPPGGKDSVALIAENDFRWGDFSFKPGLRWDRYEIRALGRTRVNMEEAGQEPTISLSRTSKAVAAGWRVLGGPVTMTYRYNEAFRPPLIDEYFSRMGFGSRCAITEINPRTGRPYSPPGQPLYDIETGIDLAPSTGICGDLYRPQESTNHELIFAWTPRRTEPTDGQWQSRLTLYRIHTRHLLTSIAQVDGQVQQPGREKRHGLEFELSYTAARWFASLSYGRVAGQVDDVGISYPIYGVPGNTLVLNLGVRGFDGRVEAGVRMRDIGDRRAYTDPVATSCTSAGTQIPGVGYIGTQYGVRLFDAYASWQPIRQVMLRASLDNVTNRSYCMIDGFGGAAGARAPGRALRLTASYQY